MSKDLKRNQSFASDLGRYLLMSKKWYLLPIVLALIVFGFVLMLGGTAAAPFIYTLF
jgi:hypothetical protein